MNLARLGDHMRRMGNARRFGVPFSRRGAILEPPKRIKIGKAEIALAFPDDHGALADFMGCFIEDAYGVGAIHSIKTILDIGANAGFFSLAARSYFPHATIHAYEPNPVVHPYLEANGQGRFECFKEAVGAEAGTVAVIDRGDTNLATTAPGGDIPQVAFREAVARLGNVDLLKMDCEGAEWSILQEEDWSKVENIRMEYHLVDGHTLDEVFARLRELGYDIDCHKPSEGFGMLWASRSDGLDEALMTRHW